MICLVKDSFSVHLQQLTRYGSRHAGLSVFCCRVLFLFFFKVLLFIYKSAAASGAGQQLEKQAEFKDYFVHKAGWTIKNIPTALAAVHGFIFHIYVPSANVYKYLKISRIVVVINMVKNLVCT